MKWAFIDYESIGNLEKIDLSAYQKIIVFLGAKQPKIDFGEKKYDIPLEMHVRYVYEPDPMRQALLEMYVSVSLGTPHNDFDNH